ncbi:uncharacterized protein MONOS_13507 [Monocercomonoides exilis]|uniref:uncharacterized protein n=1 Tax=Monocercomonoides exilis TaxID=2049356 RepID=UPI00355AB90B|nr:hypothetical protein MONOS_13507 [Monocercomonoides exilis]|eukprot:MONOS_13507.1-p1 / transcript=MONOS_13507.1 / gene=MONOS_13507 / organism=Monocercomonoides_exilis_PA203 / gene_product=unspecified product / transcript_product=unspecified product / location=Mono_scaffold00838:897-4626(-) / protein_length=1202 / sequence_SO=supercontig / SO=protein_coding / is_pseudo=false
MIRNFTKSQDRLGRAMNYKDKFNKSFERKKKEESLKISKHAILSPSQPGFFSPPSSYLVTPPSSPAQIMPPLSPLRFSETSQSNIYDNVTSTPHLSTSMYPSRSNTPFPSPISSKNREKEKNGDDVPSLTEWLFRLTKEPNCPKIDYYSSIFKSLPPQPSLDSIREFYHVSIYPRPLYISKSEDLDQLCLENLQKQEELEDENACSNMEEQNFIDKSSKSNNDQQECTEGANEERNFEEEHLFHDGTTIQLTSASVSSTDFCERMKEFVNTKKTETSHEIEMEEELSGGALNDTVVGATNISSTKMKRGRPRIRIAANKKCNTTSARNEIDCSFANKNDKHQMEKQIEGVDCISNEAECVNHQEESSFGSFTKHQNLTHKKCKKRKKRKARTGSKSSTENEEENMFESSNEFSSTGSLRILPKRVSKKACLEKIKSISLAERRKIVKMNDGERNDDNSFFQHSCNENVHCAGLTNSLELNDGSTSRTFKIRSRRSNEKKEKKKLSDRNDYVQHSKVGRPKMKRKSVLMTEENKQLIHQNFEAIKAENRTSKESILFDDKTKEPLTNMDIYGVSGDVLRPLNLHTPACENPVDTSPRSGYQTPSKFSVALRTFSKETFEPYLKTGLPISKDKKKTHAWVYAMFVSFCRKFKHEPWPLNMDAVYGFIKLLGAAVGYSIKSLRDSVLPSLYYISWYRTKEIVTQEVRKMALLAIAEIQFQRDQLFDNDELEEFQCVTKHKEPLIVRDLDRILSCIPDWNVEKPREASLFLFALATGARSLTCSRIRLRDIVRVFSKGGSSFVKVTINLACGKGIRNDDHCVTVEGDIKEKNNLNVIWWLEEYLVIQYGLTLTTFDTWNLGELGSHFLWGMRKGAMRARLQKRAKQAGYPEQMFGFHSFRSGFICSALLKIENNPELKENVLETAAYIANWKLGSPVEMQYVDRTTRGTIVANRLNFPREVLEEDVVFSADLSDPSVFHNIVIGESEWKRDSIIDTFNFFVREVVKCACRKFHYPYVHCIKLCRMAAVRYLKLFNKEARMSEKWVQKSKELVLEQLKRKGGDIVSIGTECLSTIKEYLDGTVKLEVTGKEIRKKIRERREWNFITNNPSRMRWSAKETETLESMVLDDCDFEKISEVLPHRSANACRDRIRNIIKKQKRLNLLRESGANQTQSVEDDAEEEGDNFYEAFSDESDGDHVKPNGDEY